MRDRSALNGSENVVAAPLKAGQLREDAVLLSPQPREDSVCAMCQDTVISSGGKDALCHPADTSGKTGLIGRRERPLRKHDAIKAIAEGC